MGNYLNKIENNKDYFDGEPMIRGLMDVERIPSRAYDNVSQPLQTHMRMMYGHVDWNDFVVELNEQAISLILDVFKGTTSYQELEQKLIPGMKVVIVDDERMAPVSFNCIMSKTCYIEVLTLDDAIEKAAKWYKANLTGDFAGFHLTTVYFLAAFRLALMEGEMEDKERFAKSRLDNVWREVYASMLWLVSQLLVDEAEQIAKGSCWVKFALDDYEVEDYMKSL